MQPRSLALAIHDLSDVEREALLCWLAGYAPAAVTTAIELLPTYAVPAPRLVHDLPQAPS